MKRAFFHPTSPFIFVVSDLNILWLDDPLSSLLSPPISSKATWRLWSSSILPLCGRSPHSKSFWQTWSDRADLDLSAEPVSHTAAGISKQTDSQIRQRTDIRVSGAFSACDSRSSSSSSIQHCTPSSSIPLVLVTSDMADPSLTSPSGTPLRSPNTSLTLSFPFLREGSRVWEEGKEQPLPRDLPSPLPTKRTRTYSA